MKKINLSVCKKMLFNFAIRWTDKYGSRGRFARKNYSHFSHLVNCCKPYQVAENYVKIESFRKKKSTRFSELEIVNKLPYLTVVLTLAKWTNFRVQTYHVNRFSCVSDFILILDIYEKPALILNIF